MVSKNTVQLTIHEMQTKIEKQKRLLDERKQEIEELKDLLGSVNAKKDPKTIYTAGRLQGRSGHRL